MVAEETHIAEPRSRRGAITLPLIAETLGDVTDAKAAAIVATAATIEEFEEAVAWAAGESDVMGEMEYRLAGAAAAVYEILVSDQAFDEERERN